MPEADVRTQWSARLQRLETPLAMDPLLLSDLVLPLRLAVVSIDDAYRPWAERRARLARNPFGVNRVPPGSHDRGLITAAIATWRGGGPLCLPRFDKQRNRGHGGRTAPITMVWCAVAGGLDGGTRADGAARLIGWLSSRSTGLSDAERRGLPRWNGALDGRRRCLRVEPGAQASVSSSLIG